MRALTHFWRVTREDNLVAQGLLEQAITIDPNYAQAFAVLAVTHTFGAHMGWESAATAAPIAERTGLAAVQSDGEDPWAHLALACAHAWRGRIEEPLAAYELALRLNPNFALGLGLYGVMLSYTGRWRKAPRRRIARCVFRHVVNSPRSTMLLPLFAAFAEGDYSEAIRLSREGVRQRSDFVSGHGGSLGGGEHGRRHRACDAGAAEVAPGPAPTSRSPGWQPELRFLGRGTQPFRGRPAPRGADVTGSSSIDQVERAFATLTSSQPAH